MKITIITVVYNRKVTIEQTIWSVLYQTYKDIEYIIIDGGSNDGTVDIIKKYSDKINYWISEKDSGIYNAMNKGILKATGDYIEFLNSDDALVDEYVIENIVKKIKEKNLPDIFSSSIWLVDEKKKKQWLLKTSNIECLRKGKPIPHPGVFMKVDVLKKYMFNEKYTIVSDFELLLKCVLDNKTFCFENYPTVFFSNEGISSKYEEKRIKEHYNVLREYLGINIANKFLKESNKRKTLLKIKSLFDVIGIIPLFEKIKGWKRHKCNNRYCRWCKMNSLK